MRGVIYVTTITLSKTHYVCVTLLYIVIHFMFVAVTQKHSSFIYDLFVPFLSARLISIDSLPPRLN